MSSHDARGGLQEQFSKHWQISTADSNLTLHGFRRFKTTHLLNLRYLEDEISQLDHVLYQLGLGLNLETSAVDRLGLRHCNRDEMVPTVEEVLTYDFIARLRQLLKEYDDALMAFNSVMSMETFSLLDDPNHRYDLTLPETYNTRLVRVDKRPRIRRDPLQLSIHRLLRAFQYWRISKRPEEESLQTDQSLGSRQRLSPRNNALIADILSRVILAMLAAIFLTVPLVVLSNEPRKGIQVTVVSICIVAFALMVSVTLRATSLEMMVVSAAYAAVLSVFLSNETGKSS